MKAFVINGSPRKKWNTTQAIDKAGEALKDNGFEVERIDLYDYTFKGCTSCFECKLKDAKINGVCTMKDDLRPSLRSSEEPMPSYSDPRSISASRLVRSGRS